MKTNKYFDWFNIYYSQNQEDLILKSFFPNLTNGFYIDVGAHDPEYFSVTKLHYDSGWSGINIEPQKKYHSKLVKQRKRDINLNVAIGSRKTQKTFREYQDADGLSTLSDSMKQDYFTNSSYKEVTKNYSEYQVQVLTLNEIFEEYCANKIVNFLKIDIEGFEKEALLGNDWNKNRPQVICIEANHEAQEWHSILAEAKYDTFFHDGLNEYFVARETLPVLNKHFNYPETVLRKIPLSNTPLQLLLKEMNSLYKDNNTKHRQMQKQDFFIIKQKENIEYLNVKINNLEIKMAAQEKRNSKSIVRLAVKVQKLIDGRR